MQAGLKFLSDLKMINPGFRAIAFIGDMLELGEFSESEHKAIAKYISEYNIDLVLLVGDFMQSLVEQIAPEKLIGQIQNYCLLNINRKLLPEN
jgi:UDP-N-acetylmuramyl pentapeptide synthase